MWLKPKYWLHSLPLGGGAELQVGPGHCRPDPALGSCFLALTLGSATLVPPHPGRNARIGTQGSWTNGQRRGHCTGMGSAPAAQRGRGTQSQPQGTRWHVPAASTPSDNRQWAVVTGTSQLNTLRKVRPARPDQSACWPRLRELHSFLRPSATPESHPCNA